jgi:hypothetical protein
MNNIISFKQRTNNVTFYEPSMSGRPARDSHMGRGRYD